jgi:hypothetical protein
MISRALARITTNDDLLAEIRAFRAEFAEFVAARDNVPATPAAPSDDLSVDQAAQLAEVSQQTIRNWLKRRAIGRWNAAFLAWTVSRRKLRAHLVATRGADRLPPALKD